MRTTALLLLVLLLPAPALAQAPAEQGPPGTCARLWIERNGLFAERGYCHPSALGQAQFDLSNCRFQDAGDVPLTPDDLARIEEIRAEENRLGCRVDLTATSADQAARRLVAPPGRDALVCHEGTTLANLRRGPTATAEVVARLPQGSPVHVLQRVFNPQGSHHWLEVRYSSPDGGEGRGFIYHELVAPRCEGFSAPARATATAAAPSAPPVTAPQPAAPAPAPPAPPAPAAQGALPLEVQIDLVIRQLEAAIASEDHAGTLRQIDELRRLAPSLDEIDLLYFEAYAAFHAGEMRRAEAALDRYLRSSPRDSAVYGEALALLPQVQERAARLSGLEAELSEARARQAQLEAEISSLSAEVENSRWEGESLARSVSDASGAVQWLRNDADDVCRDEWLMRDYWYRHGLNSVQECVDFRLDLGGIYELQRAETEARARKRAFDERQGPLNRRLQALQAEQRETAARIESLQTEISGN